MRSGDAVLYIAAARQLSATVSVYTFFHGVVVADCVAGAHWGRQRRYKVAGKARRSSPACELATGRSETCAIIRTGLGFLGKSEDGLGDEELSALSGLLGCFSGRSK